MAYDTYIRLRWLRWLLMTCVGLPLVLAERLRAAAGSIAFDLINQTIHPHNQQAQHQDAHQGGTGRPSTGRLIDRSGPMLPRPSQRASPNGSSGGYSSGYRPLVAEEDERRQQRQQPEGQGAVVLDDTLLGVSDEVGLRV